jgi:hypothetical protein
MHDRDLKIATLTGAKAQIQKGKTDRLAARLEAVLFYGSACMLETLK